MITLLWQAGHCGFEWSATPNGMANMEAITMKYGASPKHFYSPSGRSFSCGLF